MSAAILLIAKSARTQWNTSIVDANKNLSVAVSMSSSDVNSITPILALRQLTQARQATFHLILVGLGVSFQVLPKLLDQRDLLLKLLQRCRESTLLSRMMAAS